MPRQRGDGRDAAAHRRWAAARWAAAAVLVGVAITLVPPGTLPYGPGTAYSDAAITHWPAAHFLRQSIWQHGQWPLWNPLRMLGQPFAANPLNKAWYPPQWLVLALPPTLHLNVLITLHLAGLALGAVAWARAEKLHPLAAVLGALALGLNPKMMAHLGAGHLDIVYALAWVPWLLWAVRRLVDAPGAARGVGVGIAAALLALADLRIAFYMLPVGVVYGIALAAGKGHDASPPRPSPAHEGGKSGRGHPTVRLALSAALGAGLFGLLTAVESVPLLALGPYLTRAAITPQEAAVYSLPPRYLLGVLIADGGGFHEWMTYVGVPVLALAGIGLARRKRRGVKLAWAGMAAVALLWALGEHGPLFPLAARLAGFVSWFRVPSRAWLVVALALAALAACGLDDLLAEGLSRRGRLAALAATVAGLAWLGASLVIVPGSPAVSGLGAALAGTGAGLWLAGGGQRQRGRIDPVAAGGGLLVTTLAISLLALDGTLVEGRTLDATSQPDQAIIDKLGEWCDGVYSASFDLIGPAAAARGVPTLHGVDPFQLTWSAAAIADAAGVPAVGYSVTAPPLPAGEGADPALALHDAKPDTRRLAALGVRYVTARFPLQAAGLRPIGQVEGVYLYEIAGGPPLLIAPEDASQPLEPDTRRGHTGCDRAPNVLLEAAFDSLPFAGGPFEGGAVLVLPQAWAPGWRAWVDGQPVDVMRVGGVFVGVPLPVLGEHHVRVAYRPAADLAGAGISAGTALALGAWEAVRRIRASRAKID